MPLDSSGKALPTLPDHASGSAAAPVPYYTADAPELIHRVELDGLTALFHVRSGMTHVVAPPAPQILDALAGGTADVGTILARMAERFEIDEGEAALQAIEARLAELEVAGLVSRV